MSRWHYFKDKEVEGLNEEFIALLDRARHISMCPYIITSGYRSGDENGIDHGIKNSAHMNRTAVDLKCNDSTNRFKILKGLFSVGFVRIGIGLNHIHVDSSSIHPQNVVWMENQLGA